MTDFTDNWQTIFGKAGVSKVRRFAKGDLTGKEFSQTCPEARRVVNACKVDNARTRARHAVYRYDNRSAVLT